MEEENNAKQLSEERVSAVIQLLIIMSLIFLGMTPFLGLISLLISITFVSILIIYILVVKRNQNLSKRRFDLRMVFDTMEEGRK